MVALKAPPIALYRDLSTAPETPVGYNYGDGGIRLAGDMRTMEGYRPVALMANGVGQEWEIAAGTSTSSDPTVRSDTMSRLTHE